MKMGISIITICFNNLPELQKTCASVDAQTIHPEEHWVINGSTNADIEEWLLQTPQPVQKMDKERIRYFE
jgi:GT2 family glycosyltransferase